ncbi:MAG TPA: response regulator [Gemmatimonadaceae bacterium]
MYLPERVTIPSDSSPGLARLPRSDSPLTVGSAHPATSEEGAPTVARVERPRALLAEDEEAVRRVMARMLERLGYDVIEAADGAAALAQLVETARPWALLVSDVLMPHLDGLALANRARRRFPALPIVLLSGYGAEALTGSDDLPRGVRLLRKPVSVEEFRAAVEHAVSAVGGPAPNGEVPTDS